MKMSVLGVSAQSVFLVACRSMNFPGSTRSSSLAQAVMCGERKVGRGCWPSALGAAEELAHRWLLGKVGWLLCGWQHAGCLLEPMASLLSAGCPSCHSCG